MTNLNFKNELLFYELVYLQISLQLLGIEREILILRNERGVMENRLKMKEQKICKHTF